MRKIMIIAGREFNAAVRSKTFIISLISMPIFMLGSVAAQMLLRKNEDKSDQRYAVVDRTPEGNVAKTLLVAVEKRNSQQLKDPKSGEQTQAKYVIDVIPASSPDPESIKRQRFDLSNDVRSGKYLAFLEIGKDVGKPSTSVLPSLDERGRPIAGDEKTAVRFESNTPLKDDFATWAGSIVTGYAMLQRANLSGVPLKTVTDALRPVPLVVTRLTVKDAESGEIVEAKQENKMINTLLPMMLSLIMFMMIIMGTTPLLNSVLEEKLGRIAEVLLGSVTPFELMAGKLIGMVGLSLVGVTLYLGSGYFAAYRYGYSEYLSFRILAWFVVFLVMGILMFGSLFIAIGAASTDAKESQSLMTPVMLLATMPFFVMVKVIEQPNGGLATALSLFPFATPSLMVTRLAVPPGIPWWQPWAGMASVVIASTLCVWAGSRVFRMGLLMQGKGANFAQMIKWVIKG